MSIVISSSFQDGIRKIGRLPVSLEERPFTDRIISKIDFREREILVSSFRLDALLSSALKLSRNQASQLIEKKICSGKLSSG